MKRVLGVSTNMRGYDVSEERIPIPRCPFCDQPIREFELTAIIIANGDKAMAHEDCTESYLD